jgi:dTDP-4-dehydrorhamnose reductase
VLVVGSAGQLGFELMRAAWPCGLSVIGKPRSELDVVDRDTVRDSVESLAPALIVNAAAYTQDDRAEEEPEHAFAVNRDDARNLAETAYR